MSDLDRYLTDEMVESAADWISDRRALLEAATEGPWVVGDHDHIQGASHCACLPEYGPLVWTGRRDINGVQMLTHIHRAREPRYDSGDTTIHSTSLPYPEIVALSTTEYVPIQPGDAALIADARTSLPKALDALEAVLAGHRPVTYSFSWTKGLQMAEVCPTCHDKAGVHECGCWREKDEDDHQCAVCSMPEVKGGKVAWPCKTYTAIQTALVVES